ncbi:class I SAM-dependent methyltransferase [Streptomyces sp. SP18CS02]|uniref:class I SAM-dependent methyltransferase n=1 Tax=Streptomyces sp. SP18CS02 TaxID=3002531 RepID=UPI002E786D58|nr:class I SAM-dependent methyltransferase [Streptomyces sp. SP18CS02]MEE1754586.1 class I SAM-dependent methyltransferase [Streptomyces sp. SP18CS02]
MNTPGETRFAPEWLALREGADASARAAGLLGPLRHFLAGRVRPAPGRGRAAPSADAELVIRDLGCGTGSMGRWLAPRLNGTQHWILHDHDPDLLDLAAARLPRTGADGGRVTVATRPGDLARLTAEELTGTGTDLVTASALLDLLTHEELDRLAAACAEAGCPALLALSVAGRVDLTPADPLDAAIGSAFNDHQRRLDGGRRLLGPDAVAAAREVFARHGMTVHVESSPWRLGRGPARPAGGANGRAADGRDTTGTGTGTGTDRADDSALTAQWLRGWVGAAREQRPDLAPRATAYLRRRLEACEAGGLGVVVHHSDVLALPGRTGGGG